MAVELHLNLTDVSVDDLFKDHSIHYVRGLHNEYKASVKNAKAELHSLVGQKYRDLIRIAEDINEMSNTSKIINQEIRDISYSQSQHVAFGKNNHSRFDSLVRARRSQNAREQSQGTILNNIINYKLIDFDLKLQTNSIKSSSYLIHMAQIFYTVSQVFHLTLSSRPSCRESFLTLRQSFTDFLEKRIAEISMTDASGNYLRSNIKSSPETQWIEGDDVEFQADSFEADIDNSTDPEQGDDYRSSRFSSDPIFNYLAAYIIISHDNEDLQTMRSFAQRIVALRFNYMKELLDSCILLAPSTASNISFSAVLNYIQATQNYLQGYLVASNSNELISFLNSISVWKATDFIGFSNWYCENEVNFDATKYNIQSKSDHPSNLDIFKVLVKDYFEEILNLDVAGDEVFLCHRAMSLFYNFVCSARKSEVLAEWNGYASIVKEFCRDSELVMNVFQLTLQYVEKITLNHQKLLLDVSFLENPTSHAQVCDKLFSQDFVNLIDTNVNDYYRKVLDLASFDDFLSNSGGSSAASLLKHWFQVENDLVDNNLSLEASLVGKILKTLEKTYRSTAKFGLWGGFNVDLFKSEIAELRETLTRDLLSNIGTYITSVTENIHAALESTEEKSITPWLHLSLILVSNLSLVPHSESLRTSLENGVSKIFEKIFGDLSSLRCGESTIKDIMFETEAMAPSFESATVPVRSHLVVYSATQRLSSSLLESTTYTQDELLELYLTSATKAEFIKKKNEWISNVLIKESLNKLRLSVPNSVLKPIKPIASGDLELNNRTEGTEKGALSSTGKLSTEQSRQLLANIVFLICLTSDEEVTIENPILADAIKTVNDMSETVVEGSVLSIITRGVSRSYLSSKEIFLPLLYN